MQFNINNLLFDTKNNDGLQRLRSVKGVPKVLKCLEQFIPNDGNTVTPPKPVDYGNIEYLGRHGDVACWRTRTYESTIRFIYGLWRNQNMNSSIGTPEENSPFCTRIESHWANYSYTYDGYDQFWFMLADDSTTPPSRGTLSDPAVQDAYFNMANRGRKLLIGLTDTFNDNQNRNDSNLDGKYDAGYLDASGVDRSTDVQQFIGNEIKIVDRMLQYCDSTFKQVDILRVDGDTTAIPDKILMKVQQCNANTTYANEFAIDGWNLQNFPKMRYKLQLGKRCIEISNCPNLTSLKNLNIPIAKSVTIKNCPKLQSLEGCPIVIYNRLVIENCPELKTLKGAASVCNGEIYIQNSGITSEQQYNYEQFLNRMLDEYTVRDPRRQPYDPDVDDYGDEDDPVIPDDIPYDDW